MTLITQTPYNHLTVLTVQQFKDYVGDVPTGEDGDIDSAIADAVEDLEEHTGRSYAQRTYDLKLDGFSGIICLPKPPHVSVTSISYQDASDTTQTLTEDTDYFVYGLGDAEGLNDMGAYGAYIVPADSGWPTVRDRKYESVTIRFVAGYTTIPGKAQRGVKILVGNYFSQRGETNAPIPEQYYKTVFPLIVHSFA